MFLDIKKCGRWDLNPHERIAHKILSLARLPVPTLPHIALDIFSRQGRMFLDIKKCGRWDLNPHERIAHKILSLARLPVPTLPHIAFLWDSFISPSRRIVVYQRFSSKSTLFDKFFKKFYFLYFSFKIDISQISAKKELLPQSFSVK